MKKLSSAFFALILVASLGATSSLAQTPGGAPAGGIKPKGFFMEVGVGGQMSVYNGLTNTNQQIGGSFLVGYKLNRLILGLGLEFMHQGTYQEDSGYNAHDVINAMLFQPTVQFHLLESSPLALYLSAGVHVGFAVWNDTDTTQDDDTSTTLVGFHLGMGIRYFLHPRFCLGVEAGFRGLWVMTTVDPAGPGDMKQTDAVGAFYGRLNFAAIW